MKNLMFIGVSSRNSGRTVAASLSLRGVGLIAFLLTAHPELAETGQGTVSGEA